MYEKEKITLSKLRLENAKERLRFIPGIMELGDYKTAANRAYYAVFYAMRAVLALDGYDSKKHSGIISEFRKSYVKTGVFDSEMSDIISGLFNIRASSDYDDFYVVSKENVAQQYENAVRFVDCVSAYLESVYATNS